MCKYLKGFAILKREGAGAKREVESALHAASRCNIPLLLLLLVDDAHHHDALPRHRGFAAAAPLRNQLLLRCVSTGAVRAVGGVCRCVLQCMPGREES